MINIIYQHSMIFKTIDDNDSLSGQRIVSKFTARKIAQEEATKQLEIDIQCLKDYEAECQKGSVNTETFATTMKGASVEAQKYATNIKEGTGSAQTFATNQRTIQASMSETSIVSKVAATGLSIFKAALNSLIFFAVIEGIQLLIKGIDNLILTADEAEEKAEALRGNMKSFFDEVQSGQQTISSVSDRFSELSEHVTKTGENIDLTKDEYSEYLDICNQVKTIMPELVTGYTNEGNAIITLKDNVDSLTESYKENIRAKAAAFITNGDDDGNTIQSFFDDYKIFTEGENGLFAPSAGGLWNNKSTDFEDYYGYDKVHEWLEDVTDLSLKDLQNLQKGTTQATYLYVLLKENGYELANITEDNYEAVHDVLDTRLTSLEGEMATRVSNIKMSLQQMLYADRDYWDIDDKEALSALDSMFSSIDSEFIKQNNLLGQDALQSFESNVIKLFEDKDTQKAMIDIYTPQSDDESIEDYSKRVNDAIKEVQNYVKDKKIDIPLDFTDATDNVKGLQESYTNTINRFKSSEESSLDELTTKYQEAIDKRKELYSGENYVGNVDINNRPVVINDDGSYSTTSTAFQEKWVGDEENGHYIIAHFTPILPDGTVLDEDTLNDYIDRILNSDNPMEADKVENGGYGIVYKVDTEINGQEINDDNLEDAFSIADAWDVGMHNLQNEMYVSEAEIKSQIERFDDDINSTDGSQKIKDFFDTEGINTTALIEEFNKVTEGINDADEAIQKWNEHKNNFSEVPLDLTSQLTESDNKSKEATLADLQSEADLLKTVKKEISENGRVGVSLLQKIIKEFPEAKEAVSEYMAGLISQEELFQKLEDVYNADAEQYKKSATEKVKASTEFWNKMIEGNSYLQDVLNDFYGDDYKNWTNLETAKAQSEKKLISQLGSLWAKYYENQLAAFMLIKNADGTVSVEDNTNNFQRKTVGNKLNGFNTLPGSNIDKAKEAGEKQTEADRAKLASLQKYIDAYNKAIKAMNDAANIPIDLDYTDWSTLGDDSSSSSSSQTAEKLNWIERIINKISTAYSRLKNVVSDTTTTWLNRNNALADSMSTLRDEINAQSDAYEYYMNAFNSYGLDDYYKNQIADGSISIDVIYDDDLKDAISDCQDFYDKAQDAKTAVQELNIELKGLAKSRFDNVASEYEKQISYFKDYSDQLQKEMDIITTKGWFSSTSINESMKKVEQDNLDRLKQERDSLMSALNSAVESGKIEKYSEDWYDMQSSIDSVTSSILDAEKALIEYDNAIRQIKWDAFDRTRDDVENLISETEFLVELLKDKGITDDNGNTTAEGKAAQALLVQKYQLYLNQAQKYKDEILKIDEELANNPYDKELLDRKQDLIDKQQEAVKSSISEKDAIKDLVEEGYNDFIDKLGDAIDKYKELMSTMKDAYDYEKSIREKTEALNALEKQYIASMGDNSEEGKKNIQQLKDQINTAKDDLKDTEYEKLISDTEKILDQLQSDVQEWVDQRLDQLDTTIQDIINNSNENASNISDTINTTANEFGVKLSGYMTDIWNNNSFGVGKTLADFSTKYENISSAINNTVNTISQNIADMLDAVKKEVTAREEELKRQQEAESANNSNSSSNGSYDNSSSYSDSSDYSSSSSSSASEDSGGVNWIEKKDYYDKNSLNIDTSIVDRLKLHDYDSSFAARSQYYDQMGGEGQYYATYDQNVWMLDWMKSHGYRKGTKSAISGLHIYGEDDPGSEVLVTKYGVLRQFDSGDTVFNKDQVEKLWNLSKGITTPNMYMDNLGAKLPDISNMSNNLSNKVDISYGDVTLTFPNVHNYEDIMKQMQKDPKAEKMIQEMTLGQTLGRNSLNKLTFR